MGKDGNIFSDFDDFILNGEKTIKEKTGSLIFLEFAAQQESLAVQLTVFRLHN